MMGETGENEVVTLRQALAISALIQRWAKVTMWASKGLDGMPPGSIGVQIHTENGKTMFGGILPDGSIHT